MRFFFSVWYIYLVANSISLARNIRSKKLRQEHNEPESQSSSMLEYESSIHTRKKKWEFSGLFDLHKDCEKKKVFNRPTDGPILNQFIQNP